MWIIYGSGLMSECSDGSWEAASNLAKREHAYLAMVLINHPKRLDFLLTAARPLVGFPFILPLSFPFPLAWPLALSEPFATTMMTSYLKLHAPGVELLPRVSPQYQVRIPKR